MEGRKVTEEQTGLGGNTLKRLSQETEINKISKRQISYGQHAHWPRVIACTATLGSVPAANQQLNMASRRGYKVRGGGNKGGKDWKMRGGRKI